MIQGILEYAAIRYQTCTADCCHNVRPVLAHLAAFPVSGEAQFRAVDGAMPHWSPIGDTRPPRLPVQERGTGAVLRRCVALLTAHAREAV